VAVRLTAARPMRPPRKRTAKWDRCPRVGRLIPSCGGPRPTTERSANPRDSLQGRREKSEELQPAVNPLARLEKVIR
jgi:hypothetical protein